MLKGGWIKLYRQITEWSWYQDTNTKVVFLHLLLTVNYEDKKWKDITVKRGQRVVSIRQLADEVQLTYQRTRTAIDKLKSTQEITTVSTQYGSLITVEKYGDYQAVDNFSTQEITQEKTSNQRTTNAQVNEQLTHKEEIKNKEYKNIIINARAREGEKPVDNFCEKFTPQMQGKYGERLEEIRGRIKSVAEEEKV